MEYKETAIEYKINEKKKNWQDFIIIVLDP